MNPILSKVHVAPQRKGTPLSILLTPLFVIASFRRTFLLHDSGMGLDITAQCSLMIGSEKQMMPTLNKLRSCYHKCLKFFFGFKRRDSVTLILLHLRLPSFNTIIHNSSVIWYKDGVTVLPLMKLSAILMIYYLSVKLDN